MRIHSRKYCAGNIQLNLNLTSPVQKSLNLFKLLKRLLLIALLRNKEIPEPNFNLNLSSIKILILYIIFGDQQWPENTNLWWSFPYHTRINRH